MTDELEAIRARDAEFLVLNESATSGRYAFAPADTHSRIAKDRRYLLARLDVAEARVAVLRKAYIRVSWVEPKTPTYASELERAIYDQGFIDARAVICDILVEPPEAGS